jgi:hypothetical protein
MQYTLPSSSVWSRYRISSTQYWCRRVAAKGGRYWFEIVDLPPARAMAPSA